MDESGWEGGVALFEATIGRVREEMNRVVQNALISQMITPDFVKADCEIIRVKARAFHDRIGSVTVTE